MRQAWFKAIIPVLALMAAAAAAAAEWDQVPELTCEQFIQEAAGRDPEFIRTLQAYLQAKYVRLGAGAVDTWTVGAAAGVAHSESVSGSIFEPLTVDAATYDLSVKKLFLETGTRLTLGHTNALTRLGYDPQLRALFGGMIDTADRISTPAVTLSLVQPLLQNAFGLADRYPVEAADLQVEAARLDAAEAWENRLAELYSAYLDWTEGYETLRALEATRASLGRVEDLVTRKLAAGLVERSDWLRTRENALRVRSQLAQAEATFRNQTLNIAALRQGAGAAAAEPSAWRPRLDLTLVECGLNSPAAASSEVEDLRLVRKLTLLGRQLERQAEVAENGLWPDVQLAGGLTRKGRSDVLAGGLDPIAKTDYQLRLQASYPLGAPGGEAAAGRARAAREEVARAEASARRTLTVGTLQLEETLRRFADILAWQDEQLAAAQERLDLDTRSYRQGRLDTFLLIDAENALTQARLQHYQTHVAYRRAVVARLALTDRLLGRFPELAARLDAAGGER